MLKVGSRGSAVVALQKKLGIKADGIFGSKTRAAVITYQRAHGLAPDGIAGPKTLGKLGLAGGSSGGGSTSSSAPKKNLDYSELAQRYGWSMAMINSDPSLKKLFSDAVAKGYTADKFVAELRNTSWYKKNSETARQAAVLRTTDPATYNERINQTVASVTAMARQMGSTLSAAGIKNIATAVVTLGWNDEQVRNRLADYVKFTKGNVLSGQAGQFEEDLRAYARAMGVRTADKWIEGAVQRSIREGSIEGSMQALQQYAKSAFPHLTDRIEAGETLADIASPYQQAMGQILEINPEQIDLFDNTIRSALAGKDEKGKPAMKSIWQFEQDLRKDPRWLKTQNAQDSVMSTARKVLSDFGLAV